MDETLLRDTMDRRAARRVERRDLFRLAGGVAAGAGALALSACGGNSSNTTAASTTPSSAPTDADVLNFALNLEYLEANFYHFAVFGTPIDTSLQSGTGTLGTIQGGQQVPFTSPVVQRLATEIAKDELNHVTYLRQQLGTAAVAQPAVDLSATATSAFSMAAQSAGVVPAGAIFNPYANDESFLLGAYIFEDTGVTAYIGGSTLITSKAYLQAAAGILAVEAYHASIVRQTLYNLGVNGPTPLGSSAVAVDPFAATSAISAARAKLDGTNTDDNGIGSAGSPTVVDANPSNAVAYSRTAAQVLNIVYLNAAAVSSGGFFPSGMNGNIRTSG